MPRSDRRIVVIDTNVALSALIFVGETTARIRAAWRSGRLIPLVSASTVAELILALTYPKFALTPDEQREMLSDYLPYCRVVRIPSPPPATPRRRDPRDVPFLELAIAGKASALVTGDRDLLALRDKVTFAIRTPAKFVADLDL